LRGTPTKLLHAEKIAYRYPDGTPALVSADLTLRQGEIHALVGPNGSGKSTLALLLAGLLEPTGGDIAFGSAAPEAEGHSASLWNLRRRVNRRPNWRAGYVFQNPERQFITHSVEDELAYGLLLKKTPPSEVKRRVDAVLGRFYLEEVAGRHPFRLSGGQKRRLSVAVMLIEEPDLLILDEPTFGQDRETARAMVEEIRRLNAEGRTVLLITHDMRLVDEAAHRVTALKGGATRFAGAPQDLFAQPGLCEDLALIPPPIALLRRRLRNENR